MRLLEAKVFHTKFGCGTIVEVKDGGLFDVEFEKAGVKHFIYPDSFSNGILRFEEGDLNDRTNVDYGNKIEDERAQAQRKERQDRLKRKLRKKRKLAQEKALWEERTKKRGKERRRLLYQTAYHEAGHVIVGELLIPSSVKNAIVYSPGNGCAFFKEDSFGASSKASDLEREIMIFLAGRAAVDVVYNVFERDGVVSDCEHIRFCLDKILDKYYEREKKGGRDFSAEYEKLQKRKSKQKSVVLEYYYEKTKRLLKENRGFLDSVARKLHEKRCLSAEEVQAIKGQFVA